jgi:hypothetical protein
MSLKEEKPMAIRSDRINLAEQQAPAARKPYHTPRLEDYGEVRELTRATASYYGYDSGTFPYVYASAPI